MVFGNTNSLVAPAPASTHSIRVMMGRCSGTSGFKQRAGDSAEDTLLHLPTLTAGQLFLNRKKVHTKPSEIIVTSPGGN